MQSGNCPSEEQLTLVAKGIAQDSDAASVGEHVKSCPKCHELFKRLNAAAIGSTASYKNATVDHFDQEQAYDFEANTTVFDLGILQPSQREQSIGRLGKYHIECELGSGGFGVVFKAFDDQLMRPIAIKVLKRELARSTVARRRFLREARAAAAINHPSVVTLHAVDEHDGNPFIVMELVSGPSLKQRIGMEPKLTSMQILRISAQVAAGLAAAHAQGVIHRDIKPANIMLEDNLERVKITDFGLARVAQDNVDLTSRELTVGTPAYMSPEQVAGQRVDARSDLFGLGCVMYSMHTGHSPFHGRSGLEIARKVVDHEPLDLIHVDESIPPLISEIVARLLDKDANKRFQTAAELSDVLNRQLATLNNTASDQVTAVLRKAHLNAPEVAPSSRKRPWMWILVLAGIVVMVAGYRMFAERDWGTTPPVHESADVPGELGTQKSVVVQKNGQGDCTSLQEAFARVTRGGTITVMDAATYEEALVIDDAARWSDVTIASPQRATLRAPAASSLIRVERVPGLVVRGFHMDVPNSQRGIELIGSCPGTRFEDIQVSSTDDSTRSAIAFVHLRQGAEGTLEEPLVFRGLQIHGRDIGFVIGEAGQPTMPVGGLRVEDCLFVGANAGKGFAMVIFPGSHDVVVTRNLFAIGRCGLSVSLNRDDQSPQVRDLSFNNNTLFDFNSFIIWAGPTDFQQRIQVHSNLILQVKSLSPSIQRLGSAWFDNNWWETSEDRSELSGVARQLRRIPMVSLDPTHPEFLKPDFDQIADEVRDSEVFPGRYPAQ